MSRKRVYMKDTEAIMQRFFIAFDALAVSKKIKIRDFCERHDIDRRNFCAQRKDQSKGYFQIGWCVPLVLEHSLSTRWLITGEGSMFSSEK